MADILRVGVRWRIVRGPLTGYVGTIKSIGMDTVLMDVDGIGDRYIAMSKLDPIGSFVLKSN